MLWDHFSSYQRWRLRICLQGRQVTAGSIVLVQEVVTRIPDRVGINPTHSRKEMKRCKCCYLPNQLRTTSVILIRYADRKKRTRKSKKQTNLQEKHSGRSNRSSRILFCPSFSFLSPSSFPFLSIPSFLLRGKLTLIFKRKMRCSARKLFSLITQCDLNILSSFV